MCFLSPVNNIRKRFVIRTEKVHLLFVEIRASKTTQYKAFPIEAAKSNIYEIYTQAKTERNSSQTLYNSVSQAKQLNRQAGQLSRSTSMPSLETFRFEDEDNYEYEICIKVFSRILKIQTSRKASFHHFSLAKLALLSLVKEVTRSPDRKMIKLLTSELSCFRHFTSR